MSVFSIPVRRPVATSMLFLGLVLLGVIALYKMPVELLPPIEGNRLFITFIRPGSEPEVVEREILLPLSARASELLGVEETSGLVRGPGGRFEVRFEPGTDMKVRELEMRRVASELIRTQPRGTFIDVQSDDFSVASKFVMVVALSGRSDLNVLRDLGDENIQPRLAAVPGVSQVLVLGGSPREATVRIDPDRCAMLGIPPGEVAQALQRAVSRLQYLGGVEDEAGRTAVVLDGRPHGLASLADTRIVQDRPVLLRHVADVDLGVGRRQSMSRVNGNESVAIIVFQDTGANLVRLGRALRQRIEDLNEEYASYGVELTVSFDGSEMVEERLSRLKTLGLSGFLIALLVLYLFLRQFRAVLVVGVAVPVSLLAALSFLFVWGQSLNLITIFGLAVGIGMLVDNSIVVFEAVQRQLEHGVHPDKAAEDGVRRTARAILAASITTMVVFLPISFMDFEQAFIRSFLQIMTIAILLPLVGSVIVAVGLVPLLARRLAAPAALARIRENRRRRENLAGLHPPERARELFSGLLVAALRRPGGWLTGVAAAVLITVVVALPLVAVRAVSQEAREVSPVQFAVELPSDATLAQSAGIIERLELEVQDLDGVERVESFLQETNGLVNGSLSVYLQPRDERLEGIDAAAIRSKVRDAAGKIQGLEVRLPGEDSGRGGSGGGGNDMASLLGQGPSEVVISGPESEKLSELARDLARTLREIPEIGTTYTSGRRGQEEMHVTPDDRRLRSFALTADQVLPALGMVRREGVEMQVGFTTPAGEEIPLVVRRSEPGSGVRTQLRDLRVATPAGVIPVSAIADVRRMSAPATIQHRNGRREVTVYYRLSEEAPQTGPARQELDARLGEAIQTLHRPAGYTLETPEAGEEINWFKRILIPVVLLLFAVLAIAFESLTLPLLVLIALPLTVLGTTWALVLTGTPGRDWMALVGALALIGLTVNPAILLVDRMQQRMRGGMRSAGAAALAAVRERARPVLMTSATTVAGLWPLALVTGRENEIWPPFATVVIGGLITSTLLTLLVIPVGYVMLKRLDALFGRLGPWLLIGWVAATTVLMTPLIATGLITSLTWKVITSLLVAALVLAAIVLMVRRPERPEPEATDGPPAVEVRFLKKVYGKPGPVAAAWRLPERFAKKVLSRGGKPFDPAAARARIVPALALGLAALYLAFVVQSTFWHLFFLFVAVVLGASFLNQVRRARGRADDLGRVEPGGPEGVLAAGLPWIAAAHVFQLFLAPKLERVTASGGDWMKRAQMFFQGGTVWMLVTVLTLVLVIQLGRRTAVAIARGDIAERLDDRFLRRTRTLWRRVSRTVFGLDLPREEVTALSHVNFRAERGMIGILGPNGAGKTTLLRQLAGILDPSVGTITVGGVRLENLRRYLARYVGYLPQDFGLPTDLTAREYLDYYALLYEMKPASKRRERVDRLLREVGLGEKADQKIGGYSGGMRQRVAVARTLLRLPPVIIVDEPTVGLDPRERIRFRNLLARLAEGRVVLFSTHVVEDVAVACERVIVLSGGRMVFDGQPVDLADKADGKVWLAHLSSDEEALLPAGATVIDHVPEPDGRARLRILCDVRPHGTAEPETPSLEDGYLILTGAAAPA